MTPPNRKKRQPYLDRAPPRLAPPKVLAWGLPPGLFIEPGPGSNFPGLILGAGWLVPAARFLAFSPAFAFARWRALALVMWFSPFLFAGRHYSIFCSARHSAHALFWRVAGWADICETGRMTGTSFGLDPAIQDYLVGVSLREPDVQFLWY